jgi:outer membrane protein TolC
LIPGFEVTNSETAGLVQSDQAVALNLVSVYKALGGGWETAEANQETQLSSTSKSGL